MVPLLVGIVVGIVMCVPVGPINIWVVNTQLRKGSKEAMSIALGGSLMDFLYFVSLSSGLSLFSLGPRAALGLKSAGLLLLLALGIKELFWARPAPLVAGAGQALPGQRAPMAADALGRFFLFGVLIYASNPTLIATLTGLTAMIRSWELFIPDLPNHLWLGLGAGIGSALWFLFLIAMVKRYQHLLRGNAMLWAQRACGLLVLLLALVMGAKLMREIGALVS